jgi:hypothetical protein
MKPPPLQTSEAIGYTLSSHLPGGMPVINVHDRRENVRFGWRMLYSVGCCRQRWITSTRCPCQWPDKYTTRVGVSTTITGPYVPCSINKRV